jgi:hypothetical protein
MIPGIYNIKAYRNDTLQLTFTVKDNDGNPVSLANADLKLQVRNKPDGTIYLTMTEGNGLTVGGVSNNVITVSKIIDIAACGCYHYDLQATFTSGVVNTYVRGSFTVEKDITQ